MTSVPNCTLTDGAPKDLPSCPSACFLLYAQLRPLLLTNLRSLLPCELACYAHQDLRIYLPTYLHSNLMLRISFPFIVVARSKELESIWSYVWCSWCLRNNHVAKLSPVCSFIWPRTIIGAYHRNVPIQRNCTLHNAIHSRQTGVGPGVGVDINLRPAGGVWTPPRGFSRIAKKKKKKRRRTAPPGFHLPYPHIFDNFCESFDPGSCKVRSPGQVKWPYLTKTLQSCTSYIV